MNGLRILQGVVMALALFCVGFLAIRPLDQSDSFYHIKTGEVIWHAGFVPTEDIYSYTQFGKSWVTQEWLSELIFYGAYELGGFWGTIALVALLAMGTYLLLVALARRLGSHWLIATLVPLLLWLAPVPLWVVRPQAFSYFFLALLLFLLHHYAGHLRISFLLGIVGLLWFWANSHAAFLLGFVIMLWYAIADFLMHRASHYFGRTNYSSGFSRKLLGGAFLAGIFALMNPNGYDIFIYQQRIHYFVSSFQFYEWRSLLSYIHDFDVRILLFEIIIVFVFSLYWFGYKKGSRNLLFLGLVLGGTILPFLAVRHTEIWALMVSVPFAVGLSGLINEWRWHLGIKAGMGAGLLLLFGAGYSATYIPISPVAEAKLPTSAVQFIKREMLRGPLFNFIEDGGYLMWELWPREKVFIDSRADVYTPLNAEEFSDITHGNRFDELVNQKYDIQYFLLPYRNGSRAAPRLAQILIEKEWPLIFWDDRSLIFIRPISIHGELIGQFGLHGVNPYRSPEDIPQEDLAFAIEEMRRVVASSPRNVVTSAYLTRLLARASP